MKNSRALLIVLLFLFTLVKSDFIFAQNPDVEGMWLTCDSKDDCEEDESGLYMSFDNGRMQLFLKMTGLDPQKIGEELNYEWVDGKMVVSKKGDLMKDTYIIEIKGTRMIMTHNLNGKILYFEKR